MDYKTATIFLVGKNRYYKNIKKYLMRKLFIGILLGKRNFIFWHTACHLAKLIWKTSGCIKMTLE